ncbi:MAG: polysaccharide biosynthesis C-terminal domain-containing protein [Candidatus Omnitrophota bacterium]
MTHTSPKSIKEKIIKDTAKYNFIQYGSQFFGFIGATAMRNFLGPYLMGVWSLFRVVIDYALYTDLGVGAAAAYKIPFFKGKGDKEKETEVTNCTFSFMFIASIFSAATILIATGILRNNYPPEVIAGLIVISFYMILERLYSFYVVALRAHSNFSVINRSVVFDSIVNLILILLLVRNFKMNGLYVTVILMAVLNTLFVHRLARYQISFILKLKSVVGLIKFGFPLLLLGFLGTILRSIDRIMIAKMMGITFVGYYSIALMSKNYLEGVSNNFGIVTIPKIVEAYGKEEKVEHIKKFVTVSAEIISYLFPCLLGFVFFTIPVFVKMVMPNFIPGIVAAQILLLDIFFRSCSPQANQFLITLGKQTRMLPISIIAILINIFFNYIFIKKGFGIEGVAFGTVFASCFSFLAVLIYAMKHFAGPREIINFILRIIFPLVYTTIIVLCASFFVKISNTYVKLIINILIVAAASFPLFFYINKRTHILNTLLIYLKTSLNEAHKKIKRK